MRVLTVQSSLLGLLLASKFFNDPLVSLPCGISTIFMTLVRHARIFLLLLPTAVDSILHSLPPKSDLYNYAQSCVHDAERVWIGCVVEEEGEQVDYILRLRQREDF